ncbi:MAG: hypothetical protein OXF43_10155 [Gammaproteobacteria bacterium]|nr:hypothetical protein [Gammaproteobacteria bacterium]
MANSWQNLEIEVWIAENWLPDNIGNRLSFSKTKILLTSGGEFEFDAVSNDTKIIANISTGALKTASGKHGSGKVHKIRSDIYFLLLTPAKRKLMILSELDMYEWWINEKERGRVPAEIEIIHVEIPKTLNSSLQISRDQAAQEVTPKAPSFHDPDIRL